MDTVDEAQQLMDDRIADALARRPREDRPGLEACTVCGDPIPQARRLALPSARTCIDCQTDKDTACRRI